MILIYYLSIFYLKNGEKLYMRNCCDNCRKDVCTKKVPIFAVLNSCELIDVLEKIVHKEFEKNEIIFSEGGKAETLYFVNEGKIKLYKYTKDGKEQILEVMGERLAKMENLAQSLATNDVDARIAYLLLDLSKRYGEEDLKHNISINLPINRENMASYIGVTRETISRKLKRFEEEGLIKVVGTKKIVILNKEGLNKYV